MENNEIKTYQKFSVLMSIYNKENPIFLRECLESMMNQTVKADEWVIVKDGPLTVELEDVLNEYEVKNPGLIKYVILEQNMGLGLALRAGIVHCSFDLIARMDTDDICDKKRFEKQLEFFLDNPNVDIVGSQIKEFDGNIDNIIAERLVPLKHEEIYEYQKKRSAFNHVTVMFKKESVISAGNYKDCPLMEDDMLWVDMLINNCITANTYDFLVYVRVGEGMIERRGGYAYFKKYKRAKKMILDTGFISYWDYYYTLLIQLIVALMPNSLRRFVFFKLLR